MPTHITPMLTYDFSRSFLTFQIDLQKQNAVTLSHQSPITLNNARIQIECCCQITRLENGHKSTYMLGASCKTERVGADVQLWLLPNADFCPVVSADEFLIIKSWQQREMGALRNPPTLGVQPERQSGEVKEAWTSLRLDLCPVEGEELSGFDAINEAVLSNRPLVSRIEYEDSGYEVMIEHPVKTINVTDRECVFQTDTGPIILPDFSREVERSVEYFDLAYSAFNAADWAEFVVNAPTRLSDTIAVDHYSVTRRLENTRNRLIAI